jgi:hypothetical protein
MLTTESPEIKKLGLSLIEKEVKEMVAECCVRSDYFDKLLKGILELRVTRDTQRSWIVIITEISKRVVAERASEQLSRNLIQKVNLFLQ